MHMTAFVAVAPTTLVEGRAGPVAFANTRYSTPTSNG